MSRTGRVALAALLLVSLAVATNYSAANFEPPDWAYPATPRDFKPDPDDGKPKRLVASTKSYTYAQLQDVFAAPDWYPTDHPKMPDVVAKGRRPDVRACASCHLTSGLGHPQSGSLAGLQAEYMALQLADFRTGARHASVGDSPMAAIARALTPEEAKAAVEYFAGLPRTPWVTVIESAMAPKTRIVEGGLRIPLEPEQLEPIGQRIVEVPKFPSRSTVLDPRAPFIAYVPMGSLRRGRAFVSSGGAVMRGTTVVVPGKTPPCTQCHGPSLRGMAHSPDSDIPVPALAGRSPTYILRQLYDVQSGARSGKTVELMKPIAAQLTLQEMIDVAAYSASKMP